MRNAEAIVRLVREGASGASAVQVARRSAELLADASDSACLIAVKGARDGVLDPVGVHHPDPEVNQRLESLREPFVPRGALARAYEAGEPVLEPDASELGLTGLLAVPLTGRLGRVGVMVLGRFGAPPPDEQDLDFALDAAKVLALSIELDWLASARRRPPASRSGGTARAKKVLSDRERQIVGLLARGHTNKEVADQLYLSVRTVEWYRARIQTKLDVHGRAELVAAAQRLGLADGDYTPAP